jgi:hypothetical protein
VVSATGAWPPVSCDVHLPGVVNRGSLRDWIAGYERAWRTPDGPELDRALAALFAPHATYSTAPFEPAYQGLAAIARMWKAERKGPDEAFTIRAEIVAVDAEHDTGVLRLEVRYGPPREQVYRDLWIVRFDDEGRCEHFEEWPFWPPGTGGSYPRGPPAG